MTKLLLVGLSTVGALTLPMNGLSAAQDSSPAAAVNPFIGTDPTPTVKVGIHFDTGDVFPGAVCPRGILAWSPDTTSKDKIAGGYWYPDNKIEGFSLTHFSGRGVPCLKDITFLPLVQPASANSPGVDWTANEASFSHGNENASAGYYRVKFDNGIATELTATLRTGMARFAFPPQAAPTLWIRANGAVTVSGNEVTGRADWKPGRPKVYFAAQFEQPIKHVSTWNGDKISDDASAEGAATGAILTFDPSAASTVQVRVGISYACLENARENLARENSGWDFAAVHQKAVASWNEQLGKVEVEGGTPAQRTVFYTTLYHCFMHPNLLDDVNGDYPGMDGKIHRAAAGHHQYQNIPAWDQHRSHTAWLAVFSPRECSDVMQSLVNYAEQDASVRHDGGGLPRWEQVNINSGGMVGDGDDTMVATAYAFGARDFDLKGALAAMDKGASQPGVTSDGHKVRGGLEEYDSLGYVPDSPAVTLEYCADDFSLSQFAGSLGDREKRARYLARAQNWRKLFEPTVGYIMPRLADGTWMPNFKPSTVHGFVEGSAAQYLWMVNFDLPGLVERLGGNAKTVERLDRFFSKTNAGMSSEFAYMGNEPCEGAPWIYDFAGAPWRTQEVVRRIQTELFTDQPNGLPGNDDAGSLSSWYVFSALGLYPEVPGVAGFAVGSPVFPKATVHLENGKTLEIVGHGAASDSPYVQSLKVNDAPHQSAWIPWQTLSAGGVLAFELGAKQSTWGSDPKMAPPSFIPTSAAP